MEEGFGSGALTRIVLVSGPSGAGRSTAIHALEDMGYEAIDNMPLSLLPRLLSGPPVDRPMALGIDTRNRDFDVQAVLGIVDALSSEPSFDATFLYVDCDPDVLIRRYSETRRRHPLAPDSEPALGVQTETDILAPLRNRADAIIDTTELRPNELRAELEGLFGLEDSAAMTVAIKSFSYKRGIPNGTDMAVDCRFLRNPHWEPDLRESTGLDEPVIAYVRADSRYLPFLESMRDQLGLLLPGYREAGKTHFALAFGCTGGQHRSVVVAEAVAASLASDGWRVSIRHVALDRRGISRRDGTG